MGNGRIGAMVFGNMKTERLALNEYTLWSGYPKELNTRDAKNYLDEIRNAIFSGDYATAERIANKDFHGHWCESYLPFGNLIIDFKSSVSKSGYKRMLDIDKRATDVYTIAYKNNSTGNLDYISKLLVI